jgi:type VI secretion system secreted protein VgrG
MDFVCRLMEEWGISYYFKHSDGEHKLIMTDEMSTFESIPGSHPYYPTADARRAEKDYFRSVVTARSFTSGKIKLDEYDFENSEADQVVNQEVSPPFQPVLEVLDYPGRYANPGDGNKKAQAWSDLERTRDHHFHLEGDSVSCFPGGLVTLEDLSKSGLDGEYLALRCRHQYASQSYRTGGAASLPHAYEGHYEFIKSDKTYAPPRVTPRALIPGHQTAKVVGDGDIDVDEYGRILVRFHWDQESDQSRRCRVAQVWAGNQWGGIFTPRVGMEVLVAFLEGDPDQPYIVGALYNDKHMHPYDLPGEKTKSGLKSNSTTSGSGYNEFIFDDKDGNELVRLHAQRNLESVVENDESRDVKNDRKTEITQNDTLQVGQVLKINANTKIVITCGGDSGSKITMEPTQITMEAMMIDVKAKANLTTKGSAMAEHSSDGLMNIHAPMVKIN